MCSYCQKDISGGEGFLAPIGDKGQFKDFCEQKCLQKYEFMHFGKHFVNTCVTRIFSQINL